MFTRVVEFTICLATDRIVIARGLIDPWSPKKSPTCKPARSKNFVGCPSSIYSSLSRSRSGSIRALGKDVKMSKPGMYLRPQTHLLPHGHLAGLALAAALLLGALPAAAQTPSTAPTRSLSVEGSAEVHVAPDTALVTSGVVTEGDTAAAALSANSAALAKVIAAIRSFGVESKDLQTSGLSLTPRYYRQEKPTDRPRIIGYTAGNVVTARVHDLGKLGDLLDKVTLAGANRIDGIAFAVSNQEGLLDEARRRAVADARRKADLYAAAGGFTLGRILTLTEESAPAYRPMMARAAPAAAPAGVEVPIE